LYQKKKNYFDEQTRQCQNFSDVIER